MAEWCYGQCRKCGTVTNATDPHILQALPRRYRAAIPVRADWSTKGSTLYFDSALVDSAEFDQVTYQGGDAIMRKQSVSVAEAGIYEMIELILYAWLGKVA